MSVDPKLTITGIQELQRANADIQRALKPSGARGRAVKYGLIEGHRYAVAHTHRDTGALQASHRMKYEAGPPRGTIYIDPTARNPKTNAMTSIYGVYEHGRGRSGGRDRHDFYARVPDERGKYISDQMIAIIKSGFPK
jgi:hypothetical protein